MLVSGHLLDNRYRLDERIATGGMGDVWRGTDVVLGRTVAVKVLRPAMLADPEFAARFYGEARMLAAFRHPGVVEVFDYNSAAGTADEDQGAYLVMGFVDGEPLSAKLKDHGTLTVAETLSIMAQTADALHAAHENGTVHRDVKPGNIMVKPNGAVVLVDFGVARSVAVTSVTSVNSIVGTALYMAPEQVSKGDLSPCTDIYALGAVAYHCLSGHPPFEGENALQVALRHLEDEPEPLPAHVPPAVRELVAKAMAKNPADRYATAADFADAALAAAEPADWGTGTMSRTATSATGLLAGAAGSAAAQARSTTMIPAPRSVAPAYPAVAPQGRPSRSRMPLLLALAALAVIGVLTVVFAALADPNDAPAPPPASAPAQVDTTEPTPAAPTTGRTGDARPTRPANQVPAAPATTSRSPSPTPSNTPSAPPTTTGGPAPTGPTGDPEPTGEPEPTGGQTTEPTTDPTDPVRPTEGGNEPPAR